MGVAPPLVGRSPGAQRGQRRPRPHLLRPTSVESNVRATGYGQPDVVDTPVTRSVERGSDRSHVWCPIGRYHSVERWRTLDGVRGLAIIMVVVYHAYPGLVPMGGPTGVSLFFVLSGFLITNLLLRELGEKGRVDMRHFYGRRVRRLAPALLIYLVFSTVVFGWSITWQPLFYVGNYTQIFGPMLRENAHTWSLAVEEHFYIIWPLALVSIAALRRWRFLAGLVGILLVWRLMVPSSSWAYFATDTNAYALGLGALLVLVKDRRQPPRWALWLSLAGLVGLSLYPSSGFDVARWTAIVASLLGCVLIWSAVHHPNRLLETRVMTGVGRISYALYLWHVAVISLMGWSLGSEYAWLAIAVSVLVAGLSWHLVERPILGSRRSASKHPAVRIGAAADIGV